MLMFLIPILRLADNLDSSRTQLIDGVECRLRDGEVVLQVRARGDIDLEQWGAERAGEVFQQVYERPVSVIKARS